MRSAMIFLVAVLGLASVAPVPASAAPARPVSSALLTGAAAGEAGVQLTQYRRRDYYRPYYRPGPRYYRRGYYRPGPRYYGRPRYYRRY